MESWQRLTRVTLDSRRAKCAEIALMTSESIVHFASLHATSSQKQSYPLQCCFFVKAHYSLIQTLLSALHFFHFSAPLSSHLSPHAIVFFLLQHNPPSVFFLQWLPDPHLVAAEFSVRNFRQLCNHAPPGLLPGCTGMLPSCSTPYTADHNRK